MKAFTVYPWWAFAFCHLGKNVENRGWKPSKTQLAHGEWVAIHAGARKLSGARFPETSELMSLADDATGLRGGPGGGWLGIDVLGFDRVIFRNMEQVVTYEDSKVPRSAVVAVAQYNGATQGVAMPWGHLDGFQWRFSAVVPLGTPVPIRGQQGLWTLPQGVTERIAAQVPGAVMGDRT